MSVLRFFTGLDGRIGLRQFWLGAIAIALPLLAIGQAAPLVFGQGGVLVTSLAHALALLPFCALAAKRAADRGSLPVFGIALVAAIVLPPHLKLLLSIAWAPALTTIPLIAWLVLIVDLGLLPGAKRSASDDRMSFRTSREAAPIRNPS